MALSFLEDLRLKANEVFNATENGENTHIRVGQAFKDIVGLFENLTDAVDAITKDKGGSVFDFITATTATIGTLILNGYPLTGIAKYPSTSDDNNDTVVTPKYITDRADVEFLSKTKDDSTDHTLKLGGLKVKGDTETKNIVNSEKITTKDFQVNGTATFFELNIAHIKASGGATIQSAADGFTIKHIEKIDGKERIRLYWLREKDGKTALNMWRSGDQAICMNFNDAESGFEDGQTTQKNVSNHYYWALVTDVSGSNPVDLTIDGVTSKYNWIELSTTDCVGTVNPAIGDDVAQLGYRGTDDPARQSAQYRSSYASLDPDLTPPFDAQYEGINEFKLSKFRKTYKDAFGTHVVGTISAISDAGYHLEIDSSMGVLLDYGEVTTLTIKMCDALGKDCTDLATSWQITRNTGDSVNDTAWREKKKVKAFEALSTTKTVTFDIAFTKDDNDLADSELSTIFTIMAYDRTTGVSASKSITF